MEGYEYDRRDGKLHTRYTDVVRCTPRGVIKVAKEYVYGGRRFSGSITEFGRMRHEMFANETARTGRTPEVFKYELGIDLPVDLYETAFAMEVVRNVVLHSRIDAYSASSQTLIDYKTFTNVGDMRKYKASKQGPVYARQLIASGKLVKRILYIGERWNAERTEVLGYEMCEVPYTLAAGLKDWEWLVDRVERLDVAVKLIGDDARKLADI